MLIALAWIALLWSTLVACFISSMYVHKLRREGTLTLFWLASMVIPATAGVALDALLNLTAGTVLFLELPRELLMTQRVQRHVNESSGKSRVAMWWARQLNVIDAGHVTFPTSSG